MGGRADRWRLIGISMLGFGVLVLVQDNFSACGNNGLGEKQDSFSAEMRLSHLATGRGGVLSRSSGKMISVHIETTT